MNRILISVFIVVVGLFIFNHKNPAKFQQMITQPVVDLKNKVSGISYNEGKKQFDAERIRIMDKYSNLLDKYKEPLNSLEFEKEKLTLITNPDFSIKEKITAINEKIREKKEEYLAKKAEIEQQVNDLEQRYQEIKDSIKNFQNSIQKIKEGIQQGQESIDSFSNALNLQ